MIKYGKTDISDLKFVRFIPTVERRDDMLLDIWLRFELDSSTPLPDDITDLSAWVIATHEGKIVDMIPQDEDTDCEYRHTSYKIIDADGDYVMADQRMRRK
jgi:hypothetical protein